jgi:hypothetical protein
LSTQPSSSSTPTYEGTPIPNRHRRRGLPLQAANDDTELVRKKQKTAISAFELIADTMEAQRIGRWNNIELGIQLLEEQYQERLSTQGFIAAINVLKDDSNASVFITLKSTTFRDRWLCKEAGVELEDEECYGPSIE